MKNFHGTWRLVLLALRRDRIKLPVWIVVLVGLLSISVPTLHEVYGSSQKLIDDYAATMANSFIGRLFGGPIDGPYFGSIVMMEYFLFSAVLIIFMSTLAVVRHTRQNEETGRSELIGSGIVGRHAPLTAALLVVSGANILIGTLIAVSLIAQDLPAEGSIAMAVGLAGAGIVFAAIAAVVAQIIESARGTNAAIGALIGVAILLRGLGDGFGNIVSNGLAVQSAWPSWLSPIGWGQQMQPFSDTHWWIVWLFVGAFALLTGLAYFLTSHRDHGRGMIASRLGRARARKWLLSPIGLAWRLQRATLLGWGIGIVSLSVILGISAIEFKEFFEKNEQLKAIIEATVSGGNFTDIYFSYMMLSIAFMLAGYALHAILRLASEESSGRIETILGTAVGRYNWAFSHIIVVVLSTIVLAILSGASTGIAYALVAENAWVEVERLTIAGLVQAPAVLIFVGFAVTVFGIFTRWSNSIVWSVFAFCLMLSQLGAILKLPDWTLKISPFYHTPTAPAASIDIAPLITMSFIALGLILLGLAAFKNRNIDI